MINCRASPFVGFDSTAEVMRCRGNGNHSMRDVYANTKTFGINSREMIHQIVLGQMTAIEVNIFFAMNFHFVINGSGHDIARSQWAPRIIFIHECFTLMVSQFGTKAPQGFRNEEGRSLRWIKQGGRMKLNKFHIFDNPFCPIDHGYTITRCNRRIGRSAVNIAGSSCG
ncbi:MAG: hypothetical protein BWX51_01063 [Bacteroidetes bacterium ADurb.Bin012]|nr:MAG: hypothetical protein BWX51_01063 [Bacteroidetes bacterium ADurb.Bin012]